MNLKLFFVVLRARFPLAILALLLSVAAGWFFTSIQTVRYTATTSLVLNTGTDISLASGGISNFGAGYTATQVDIIRSKSVAIKVAKQLAEDPNSITQEQLNEQAGFLLRHLIIEPARDSRVMNISYEAEKPDMAARIANAFVEAYIAVNLQLSTEPAKRSAEWFDKQLVDLRQRLDGSQEKLVDFQQTNGVIAIGERLDTEARALEDLTRKYTAAQAEVIDLRGRQLGGNHPQFIRAIDKESAAKRAVEGRKDIINKLNQQRDQIAQLEREIQNEQQMYDSTLKSYYQSLLQSQLTQTNISILYPAVPPANPSSPNLKLNMAAALLLGLALGVVIVILAEVLFRKVRTDEDAADILGAPVLASI